MPTPLYERPLPDHVQIPEVPNFVTQAWSDLLKRTEGKVVRWRRREVSLYPVVDGRSAARALHGYRYTGPKWADESGTGPGEWQAEWIVLGERDGDPVIADLAEPDVPILTVQHGVGQWRPRRAHQRFVDLVEAIVVSAPRRSKVIPEYVPPPRNSSLTLLDWGPDRAAVVEALVKKFPTLYQPHMFDRRRVEVPVVLTKRYYAENLRNVARVVKSQGGTAEVGEAIAKPVREESGT